MTALCSYITLAAINGWAAYKHPHSMGISVFAAGFAVGCAIMQIISFIP